MGRAAEIARRIDAAARRRRNRHTRQSADNWVREGGAVPALLIDRVKRNDSWTDGDIERVFGLDRRDGKKLMKRCGYRWSRTRESYWAPMDKDAVN